MQQNTFCCSLSPNFQSGATRLQPHNVNPYPMHHNISASLGSSWPETCMPQNVINNSSAFNNLEKSSLNCMGITPTNICTPVSTALYGTTDTFSWAHTVPSLMPWVTKGDTTVPEPLVRFTAPFPPDPCTSKTATSWELLNNLGTNKTNTNFHLKRKSDPEPLEVAPLKQCITEEKMAARLRELHISNQYSVPAESSPFGPFGESSDNSPEKSVTNLQQLETMLKETDLDGKNTKSLILAPEIKKLVEPEKLFARTFLEKVERPSMAVVVWQPQEKVLGAFDNVKDEDKDQNNSNNYHISSHETNNNSQNILMEESLPFSTNQQPLNPLDFPLPADDVMDT